MSCRYDCYLSQMRNGVSKEQNGFLCITTTKAKIYIYIFIYLFIYLFNLFIFGCTVFVAVHGLFLVAASGGCSWLQCVGFSFWWLLLLWSTGSRRAGFSSCGTWAQ